MAHTFNDFQRIADEVPVKQQVRPVYGRSNEGKRMDILLVDDSKTMRMIVQRAIRQAGFRGLAIEEAESGAEALDKLSGKQPKIVLSDWNMPEMLGIDLLEKLRGQQNKVPFGFVTSEASPEIRQRALDAGALFVITKPFGPEDFQDALSSVLEG